MGEMHTWFTFETLSVTVFSFIFLANTKQLFTDCHFWLQNLLVSLSEDYINIGMGASDFICKGISLFWALFCFCFEAALKCIVWNWRPENVAVFHPVFIHEISHFWFKAAHKTWRAGVASASGSPLDSCLRALKRPSLTSPEDFALSASRTALESNLTSQGRFWW